MQIRTKTITIASIVLLVLLIMLVAGSFFLVIGRHNQLEIKQTQRQIERILNSLQETLDTLAATVGDWAPWDATYRFIDDLNADYIEENLVESTFSNLRVNFMLFYNREGALVHSEFHYLNNASSAVLSEDVLSAIQSYPVLLRHSDVHSQVIGILRTVSLPLLVAAAPIVTSELRGPIRGTLVIGRILDGVEIKRIAKATQSEFSLHRWTSSDFKEPADKIRTALEKGDGFYITPVSAEMMAGYSQVTDLTGMKAFILETVRTRELYQFGLVTWRQHTLMLVVFALSFVVLLVFLINRSILRPLTDLTYRVIDLTQSDNRSGRLEVNSSDEIGQLADRINSMLSALNHYHDIQVEDRRYLRQVLDSINCGVMVVDAQKHCIVDVNSTGTVLFERQRQDIIGKRCHRLVCPKETGQCPVVDHHQTIDLSERKLLKPDGTTIPILKSVVAIDRNGRTYLIESFIDISNLQKTQAELKRSEERYRRFFNEDITGDFLISRDGRIIDCNPAFARMFGYETVTEIKSINMEKFYLSRTDQEQILGQLQQTGKLERIELAFVNRENHPLYCVGNLIGNFDSNGKLSEISGYFLDDTKRVLLEKDLRQAQKMEAIGTLAGGIAHDFNNILSGIMGYTEIALTNLPPSGNPAKRLNQAMKAANRAKALVQQILAFSCQSESDNQTICLAPIVDEVTKLMRASLPATIEVEQEAQSDLSVFADPVQIHQVLLNLCTNAGHAMKKKGGRLQLIVKATAISQTLADRHPGITPGEFVHICVRDNGQGIAPDIMDRIFDPFFTTKDKAEGTGMGLSVVHGIVSKLEGAIEVSSSPQGTQFDIYLPRVQAEVDEFQAFSQMTMPKGRENVVFIDDEDSLVDIGTEMLETLGYQAVGFTNSSEGLDYVLENPDKVDLVITDMTMPGLTGMVLARRLLEELHHLPIIICTGYSEEIVSESSALALGVRGFIMKPVLIKELACKIRQVLDAPSFVA